jgi:hypothetical protein
MRIVTPPSRSLSLAVGKRSLAGKVHHRGVHVMLHGGATRRAAAYGVFYWSGPLDDGETELMKSHPRRGRDILASIRDEDITTVALNVCFPRR